MFKPLKCHHSELEYLRFQDGRRYMSLRGVVNAAYPCMTSKQWVLVWKMKSRQEALDYTRDHFPEIVTGRDGSITYYTSKGERVPMSPKLHTDQTLEAFLAYFGTQDRPSRDWRDALRKDSDRRRELHDFMEHMVAHRYEFQARNLMGMRDYQKPFIDGLSNNLNNLFGSFGRLRAPRRGDLARLARTYDPMPLGMRGMEGGFKRGEMCFVGSSGSNMSHMRASLEAMRRWPDVHARPLVRVSFEDSNIDEKLRVASEVALRDVVTDLPSLGYVAFGNNNLYSSKILADETWVTNGPFDPTKAPDIMGRYYREAIDDTVPPSINLSFDDLVPKERINIREHAFDIDIAESYPKLQTTPRELLEKLGYKTVFLDEDQKEVDPVDIQHHALNKGMSLKEAMEDMGVSEHAVGNDNKE